MNGDIKFVLERYRSGGRNRFDCPKCGQKKCFTRYVDVVSNEYVADECGKCNHESSCGYHYPPRMYFKDHPDVTQSGGISNSNNVSYMQSDSVNFSKLYAEDIAQTIFFDTKWVEEPTKRKSSFRSWFESLSYDNSRIQEVLAEYFVGGTTSYVIKNGINYGPATIFWMIDEKGRAHDAKMIAYKTDGHRVQNWGDSMRSMCERRKIGPQLKQTEKVLFGLHLLPKYTDKTVCIVESEKSALVCSLKYPEFLWLATGGCGNLQPSKLRPLMDRKIIVFPDSGELEKWRIRMHESGHKRYTIVEFLEQYESNTDIADIILGEAKLKDNNK